jgi:hypothetical protein
MHLKSFKIFIHTNFLFYFKNAKSICNEECGIENSHSQFYTQGLTNFPITELNFFFI